MKRKVLASVIGAAGLIGMAASSYGQGQVFFDNYDASPYFNVQYQGTGQAAGADVSVQLGYAVGANQTTGFILLPDVVPINPNLSQANGGAGPAVGGWFQGPIETLTGVGAGQAVTLELWGWTTDGGASYANAAWHGTMIWTEPAATLGGNGLPASDFTGLTSSLILTPTPEPTTLALAGLGGLASLVAFRRKQS